MQRTDEVYTCCNSPTNSKFSQPTVTQTSHCKACSPGRTDILHPSYKTTLTPLPLARVAVNTEWHTELCLCLQPCKCHCGPATQGTPGSGSFTVPAGATPGRQLTPTAQAGVLLLQQKQGQHILTQLPAPRKRRNPFSFSLGLHWCSCPDWPVAPSVKCLKLPGSLGLFELLIAGLWWLPPAPHRHLGHHWLARGALAAQCTASQHLEIVLHWTLLYGPRVLQCWACLKHASVFCLEELQNILFSQRCKSYEEQLRELALFSLKKGRLRGHLTTLQPPERSW